MKNLLAIFCLSILSISCSDTTEVENLETADLSIKNSDATFSADDFPFGTRYSISEVATQGAYQQFIQSLRKNEAISIIAEVDHEQNAKSVGLELEPTRVVFFGNPQLGTPLMQENQLAGLDLPQKVLFYRDEMKTDFALYNSAEYLRSRYGLDGVATLPKISAALENLVSSVTKNEVLSAASQTVGLEEGIITKSSENSFAETLSILRNAITSNANLTLVFELDHQENAASAGLDLEPTTVLVFGNPNLGTPLMQEEQTIGLDLPQKMLVWENASGEVYVSYNDIYYLAERHSVDMNDDILVKIAGALDSLSDGATSN